MNAIAIPQTTVKSKNIQDDGDLAVSRIKVDHLAEKTAAHNIVGDNPIVGNAPTLTLTGPLNANGNQGVGFVRKKYVASSNVLAQILAEQDMYSNYPVVAIPFGMFAPGSVIRVLFDAKKPDATACNVTIKDNAANTLSTDTLTQSYQTFSHDFTISADGGLISTTLQFGVSYTGAYSKIQNIKICGTLEALITTPQAMVSP